MPGLGLRAGPVSVPLELLVPSLAVDVPVLRVGITSNNVMDAPMGPAKDPVWQEAFWYRAVLSPERPAPCCSPVTSTIPSDAPGFSPILTVCNRVT